MNSSQSERGLICQACLDPKLKREKDISTTDF